MFSLGRQTSYSKQTNAAVMSTVEHTQGAEIEPNHDRQGVRKDIFWLMTLETET